MTIHEREVHKHVYPCVQGVTSSSFETVSALYQLDSISLNGEALWAYCKSAPECMVYHLNMNDVFWWTASQHYSSILHQSWPSTLKVHYEGYCSLILNQHVATLDTAHREVFSRKVAVTQCTETLFKLAIITLTCLYRGHKGRISWEQRRESQREQSKIHTPNSWCQEREGI